MLGLRALAVGLTIFNDGGAEIKSSYRISVPRYGLFLDTPPSCFCTAGASGITKAPDIARPQI